MSGNTNLVSYEDSNLFYERAGNLNANTGDTRTSGLNVVDSIGSAVQSGNSTTMADSSGQPDGCGGAPGAAPPVPSSGASAGVVGSDNTAVATGDDVLVIGGDGVQDGGVTVDGDRNVVTYDDGNVAVGGTGDMNAQVGDSESGGAVVMKVRDSTNSSRRFVAGPSERCDAAVATGTSDAHSLLHPEVGDRLLLGRRGRPPRLEDEQLLVAAEPSHGFDLPAQRFVSAAVAGLDR